MKATWRTGLPPGSVALYDADARLATPMRPPAADTDAAMLREWAAVGWIALGDLAKYLDRGSLWEAYARLQEARGETFKLWAAGSEIDFPGYGLTAILDTPGAPDFAGQDPHNFLEVARSRTVQRGNFLEVARSSGGE